MNVIHIDAGREWRGGQQQAFYLHRALVQAGHASLMVCQPDVPMATRCRDAGLPVELLPVRAELDPRAARQLARLARAHGADLLHAHCSHALSVATWSRLWHHRPGVIGARRVDFHVRKPVVGPWKYNHPWVDAIICVSEKIRQVMLEDGVRPEKLVTVHSGVDLGKFADIDADGWREEWHVPADHMVVGTVAAFDDHKDYPNLVAAATRVLAQHDDVTFCAVGDGPLLADVQEQLAAVGIADRFLLPGFREDIGRFLEAFDVFVLASKTEGLGTSLLDAQAVGLPVIGTRAGGIPEIVVDGVNGLLVDAGDAGALATAITSLVTDRERQERFGENGRHGVERFSVDNTVRETLAVYERLVPPTG